MLKRDFLEGPALALVHSLDNMDEIWSRLKAAYGDTKLLLKKKLCELEKMNSPWKSRNPTERTVSLLSKLINVIKAVMKLSEEPNIESKLYYGEGINRIYGIRR